MRFAVAGLLIAIVAGGAVLVASGPRGDSMEDAAGVIERAFGDGSLHGAAIVARPGTEGVRMSYGQSRVDGGAITVDSRFRIASLTKIFTQIAVLRLVEQGKVDLDAPLARYRAGFDAEWADRITIRQLLTFRSGLPRERSGAADPIASGVVYDEAGRALAHMDSLVDDGPTSEPGTRTAYSNLGYMHLGAVIESVTGMSFEDALDNLIFAPAGMRDTGMFGADELDGELHVRGHTRGAQGTLAEVPDYPVSVRYAAGGLYSSARDLERLSIALLNGSVLGDESFRLLLNGFGREDDSMIRAAGLVPGFGNVWILSAEPALAVITLNNAVGRSPEAIVDTADEVYAVFTEQKKDKAADRAHDKRLKDEDWLRVDRGEEIPAHRVRDAALAYLAVVESLDEEAIYDAQLAIRGITEEGLAQDDIDMYKWLAMYQRALYERQGPFGVMAWRLDEGDALQIYCAGPEGNALRFTFVPRDGEGSAVRTVKVATMGFDPDADLFETGGPNKIERR